MHLIGQFGFPYHPPQVKHLLGMVSSDVTIKLVMQRVVRILTVAISLLCVAPAFPATPHKPPKRPPVYHPSAASKKKKPKKGKQVAAYGRPKPGKIKTKKVSR